MIKANFKAYSTYITDSLHQWDINQTLEVTGLNLLHAPEVHFSNSNLDRAIVRQASLMSGIVTVSIPNALLQEPFRIFAHIGVYEGDTFKVIELVEIPVIPRKRPADYQLTDKDDEVYSFKRLENMLANKATKAQVANLITANNDTDGNSELVDVRYGEDGKTYASAGEAIRAQVEASMSVKTNGAVYPSDSGSVDFILHNASGAVDVILQSNGLSFITGGHQSGTMSSSLTSEAILDQLDGAAVLTEGSLKITVPAYNSLCLNASTSELEIKHTGVVGRYDVVLVSNSYANVVGGALLSLHYKTTDNQLRTELRAINSTIYVSSNGEVKVETFPSTGKARVRLAGSLNYALADGKSTAPVNITTAQIVGQLGEGNAKLEEEGVVIYLNTHQALCFSTKTKTLAVRANNNIEAHDLVLLTNAWANVSGWLAQKAAEFDVKNLQKTAAELQTKVAGIEIDQEKVTEYTDLFNDSEKVESFLFFTDPHLMPKGENYEHQLKQYVETIEQYYKNTPTSFAVCGGDWLGSNDTQSEAKHKLGRIDGLMRSTFDHYYVVVGNHDTNYQGVDASGAANSGRLDDQVIANLWNREHGRNYYAFDGCNTRFYVLDTGVDWDVAMNSYRWEQIAWLGEQLKSSTAEHSALLLHIGVEASGDSYEVAEFASKALALCGAYNRAERITLNGSTYDFTGCSGRVCFALSGHTHEDHETKVEDIPLIATTHTRSGSVPTFELCLADYDANTLHLVRVGTGESRSINL
jgi:predicted phosphodiesterase